MWSIGTVCCNTMFCQAYVLTTLSPDLVFPVLTAHALPRAVEQHLQEENQGTELHRGAYDEEGNTQTALVLIKQEVDWVRQSPPSLSPRSVWVSAIKDRWDVRILNPYRTVLHFNFNGVGKS